MKANQPRRPWPLKRATVAGAALTYGLLLSYCAALYVLMLTTGGVRDGHAGPAWLYVVATVAVVATVEPVRRWLRKQCRGGDPWASRGCLRSDRLAPARARRRPLVRVLAAAGHHRPVREPALRGDRAVRRAATGVRRTGPGHRDHPAADRVPGRAPGDVGGGAPPARSVALGGRPGAAPGPDRSGGGLGVRSARRGGGAGIASRAGDGARGGASSDPAGPARRTRTDARRDAAGAQGRPTTAARQPRCGFGHRGGPSRRCAEHGR